VLNLQLDNEFKINDSITLKLEENRTNIYVKGELFQQCKFLLIEIHIEKMSSFDEIDSIDEAVEKLDRSLERRMQHSPKIPPETEFWGHCSNMQVWAENNYDTRLLHSNLAFPLLKELYKNGDPVAKQVFSDEITKRLESRHPSVCKFLEEEGYVDYISNSSPYTVFRGISIQKREGDALRRVENLINERFILVDKFHYEEWKSSLHEEGIEDWWEDPAQVYINDKKVKGIAIMDAHSCEDCFSDKGIVNEYGEIILSQSELCQKCGFVDLPRPLLEFKHLKELFVYANSSFHHVIPDWIQEMETLEVLYFDAIGSDNLPLLIGNLRRLKILRINNCRLTELSHTLGHLKNLNTLDLRRCNLKQLPEEIGELAQLEYLYLDGNNLEELPKSISKLSHLKVLSLTKSTSYRTGLTHFPESICNIMSLTHLYLDGQPLASIPEEIGNLINLEELSLDNTKISSIPDTVGKLINLKQLNVRNCKLTSLPDSLTQLSFLQTVNIQGNILSEISPESATHLIKQGIISRYDKIYLQMEKDQARILNEIEEEFNIKLKKVKKLSPIIGSPKYYNKYILENDKITTLRLTAITIPKAIRNLTHLKKFELLDGKVQAIPSFLGDLNSLESLTLAHCGIKKISNLEKLVHLKTLNLSRNIISEIKGLDSLTELKQLDLSSNKITEIKNLESLSTLETLELSGNQIKEIKGVGNLVKLTDLSLNNNQIRDIKGLENLTDLWFFWIYGNNIPQNLLNKIAREKDGGEKFVQYCQRKVVASQHLDKRYVRFKGQKYYVWNHILRIKEEGVNSIDEIKGFDKIGNDLICLDLSFNNISEIKGLEKLTNLEVLIISSNRIREIKGLETLPNLRELDLNHNGIPDLKGIGHLSKLEILSIPLPYKFWNDFKALMGEGYYNEVGVSHGGYTIQNVRKLVEFCKIKEEKIKSSNISLIDIIKVLYDGKARNSAEIAKILNRSDKWDMEIIRNLIYSNKEVFVTERRGNDYYWTLKYKNFIF
jgi:Leucine-rich repeat (LRR) protein